jgi:hypothetical protein
VTIHERTEGNVQVRAVPEVTIGDKPLAECSTPLIRREILKLVKQVSEMREQLITRESACTVYRDYLETLSKTTPHDNIREEINALIGRLS